MSNNLPKAAQECIVKVFMCTCSMLKTDFSGKTLSGWPSEAKRSGMKRTRWEGDSPEAQGQLFGQVSESIYGLVGSSDVSHWGGTAAHTGTF